jgi:Asp/Glu/Hydantoin racemase
MTVNGGSTLYGLALGVLMLDTQFPRALGDVGNAATWPFPVTYHVVEGAIPERMAQPDPDPALLAPFVEGVRRLERDGVPAIVTSCGFLAAHQDELVAAASVPVFSSPLLQVPFAARSIGPDAKVGILTARTALTERHFRGAGWDPAEISTVQLAPAPDSEFVRTFVENRPHTHPAILRREVRELSERLMAAHPDVGAVVLECANFGPFSPIVRRVTGLPVFDLYTLGMHAYLATTGPTFDARA